MFGDRSQLVVIGGGTLGAVLIAFVLAYGQPQGSGFGNGNSPNGGPGGPNGGGPHRGPQGPSSDGHHGHDDRFPVYQRHAGEWKYGRGDSRRDAFGRPWMMPQVSSGYFQRPYPYHLDYYKMRWGGSYAPYFGNLYGVPFGTPQVVNGGAGYGPGEWGPTGGGVPPQAYEWMDGGQRAYGAMQAVDANASQEKSNAAEARTESTPASGESLPAPTK